MFFYVYGSNNDGVWSDQPASYAFSIAPVYYQSWWFRLFVGLLAMGLAIAVTRQVRLSQRLQVALIRNRLADDLHDGFGGTVSAIALFMEGFSRKEIYTERDREAIAQQSRTAQQLVEDLRDYVWAVDSNSDELSQLLDRMANYAINLVPEDQLSLSIEEAAGKKKVELFHRRNAYLLFKEALNNAVRHTEQAKISINMKYYNNRLYVEVSDSGSGFKLKKSQMGRGMNTMRRRAKEMNVELLFESTKEGTKVSFWIPLI